jgi:hypothetical protein
MTKAVIHISDVYAASDFASLLEEVREGAEVVTYSVATLNVRHFLMIPGVSVVQL